MVVKKDKLSLLRYVGIRDAMYNLTIVSTAIYIYIYIYHI